VLFGAAGVIDGLSAFYPKTVVRLMKLISDHVAPEKGAGAGAAALKAVQPDALAEIQKLQYVVSRAEEFIVRTGVLGIKEATYRVAGFGTEGGGRVPLKGRLSEADWNKWHPLLLKPIEDIEKTL